MPIIPVVGRSLKKRFVIFMIYFMLSLGGVTMVYPFLITLTSSVANGYDYNRHSPVPAYLYSRPDRFTRGLVDVFSEGFRGAWGNFKVYFKRAPDDWTTWKQIGEDGKRVRGFANSYLEDYQNHPEETKRMAADYSTFSYNYPLDDSFCAWDDRKLASFFLERYSKIYVQHGGKGNVSDGALRLLKKSHGLPYNNFYQVSSAIERSTPMDYASSIPSVTTRGKDFTALKDEYRRRVYAPWSVRKAWFKYADKAGFKDAPYPVTDSADKKLYDAWLSFLGEYCPLSENRPFAMKPVWIDFLQSETARAALGVDSTLDLKAFNKLTEHNYPTWADVPFPIPAGSNKQVKLLWEEFVRTRYPARNISLSMDSRVSSAFQAFLKDRFVNIRNANRVLGISVADWSGINLPTTAPPSKRDNPAVTGIPLELWLEFVQQKCPLTDIHLKSAEVEYQKFLLDKYKSLAGINQAYGWKLNMLEEAEMPFAAAYTVYFAHNEFAITLNQFTGSYSFVLDYLVQRGRALFNTLILVALTVLASLTVNPLAAYALSRFQMKSTAKIILFCLATSAFPAAVTVIPSFILMRDLGLLNTYAALILPGLANGMAIFLLKGFFDSLPQELYEAATIDGAPEWQVFLKIAMPLSKPILAVNALYAFLAAYGGWEWALVVCQKESMWTLSVWVYQCAQSWAGMPWAVMAMFVVASIPTLVVFLLCQNVIMRGIILPSMK